MIDCNDIVLREAPLPTKGRRKYLGENYQDRPINSESLLLNCSNSGKRELIPPFVEGSSAARAHRFT